MSETDKTPVRLSSIVGLDLDENFMDFDLTEVQNVLIQLRDLEAIDLAHAELIQQLSLRGADILSEYLGRITKTVGYLESQVSKTENKTSLEYVSPEGKTTADQKKYAGKASPEVERLQIKLATAKGSKVVLEKKYDILIKFHHHAKEIAQGMRKTTAVGY